MKPSRTLLALSLGLALAAPLALLARADADSGRDVLPAAPTGDQATTSRLVSDGGRSIRSRCTSACSVRRSRTWIASP